MTVLLLLTQTLLSEVAVTSRARHSIVSIFAIQTGQSSVLRRRPHAAVRIRRTTARHVRS
jgi:hypothetical protein